MDRTTKTSAFVAVIATCLIGWTSAAPAGPLPEVGRLLRAGAIGVVYNDQTNDAPGLARNAAELGELDASNTIVGSVGGNGERSDTFCFTVAGPTDLQIDLTNNTENVSLYLYNKRGRVIAKSKNDGAADEQIIKTVKANKYYVRVYRRSNPTTPYTISIAAAPNVDGDNPNGGAEKPRRVPTNRRPKNTPDNPDRDPSDEPPIGGIPVKGVPDDPPGSRTIPGLENGNWPVYDHAYYIDRPDLGDTGMEPIRIMYIGGLFPPNHNRVEPHESTIRYVAREMPTDRIVIFDIEHWSMEDDERADTIRKLKLIAQWVREENPDITFGYYSLMPHRDYWTARLYEILQTKAGHPWWEKNRASIERDYEHWAAINEELGELAEVVDVICPSIYALYADDPYWRYYARRMLRESRVYGKPVIPFLWPQIHSNGQPSRPESYSAVSADFWREQLMTARTFADGAIIWSQPVVEGREFPWEGNNAWWPVTQQIMSSSLPSLIGD